jgi:hypothetical protein
MSDDQEVMDVDSYILHVLGRSEKPEAAKVSGAKGKRERLKRKYLPRTMSMHQHQSRAEKKRLNPT